MDFINTFSKYSSNDYELGTDKIEAHSYGTIYFIILSLLKRRPNLSILEIGSATGAFLKFLNEYLPDSELVGIDINPSVDKDSKITIYSLDANDKNTPTILKRNYDLIIEDSSHIKEDQINIFNNFLPFLKTNSLYIIEDITDIHYIESNLNAIKLKYNIDYIISDHTNIKGRHDDIICIINYKGNIINEVVNVNDQFSKFRR